MDKRLILLSYIMTMGLPKLNCEYPTVLLDRIWCRSSTDLGSSLPDMPAMQGMYLRMSPGGSMADTTSPPFNVQFAAAMPGGESATPSKSTIDLDLSVDGVASSANPYYVATSVDPAIVPSSTRKFT